MFQLTLSRAAALLLASCVETASVHYRVRVPEQRGTPADVTTSPGRYEGYELIGECSHRDRGEYRVVLRGQGPRLLAATTPEGWSDHMVEFRARAEAALAPTVLAVWYGYGGCHRAGYILTAYVATYRDIDAAIVRVGALLRAEQLGEDAEIALFPALPEGPRAFELEMPMPLARRAFFPYEASVSGGARYDGAWDSAIVLHLGAIWGREAEPPSKAGWFWGLGLDARAALQAAAAPWSAGPSLRFGRAFGALDPDRPGPSTHRGTYAYAQLATEWSADGPVFAASLGLTSLAAAEAILTRHNRSGNEAYLLLLPLALFDHVELAWEIDAASSNRSRLGVFVGFSL